MEISIMENWIKLLKNWYAISLVNSHKRVKLLNVLMLVISGIMFFNGGIGSIVLPEFAKYSEWDIWIWTTVLYSLALVQIITLVQCDCPRMYRWSNTVLILSGFVLLIVGCLFGFKYPPYSWQMTTYPFVGFLFSLVGRQLNKVSLKGLNNGKDS